MNSTPTSPFSGRASTGTRTRWAWTSRRCAIDSRRGWRRRWTRCPACASRSSRNRTSPAGASCSALEPKPYEPRGRILFGTTPEGVLLGRDVEARLTNPENRALLDEGHALCCMNPEVGHVLMGFEDLAYAFSWPLSEGRLAHSHWNSQPLGNYDQDLNVGVVSPEQLEALLYTLKRHGYRGHFGIDINPERMPVDTALRISMDAIRAANDRVNELDHEAIMFAHAHPEQTRGWLEAYMIRARAPHPDRLAPLLRPGDL